MVPLLQGGRKRRHTHWDSLWMTLWICAAIAFLVWDITHP